MKSIVLVGSGGCMREIAWQIQEQNKEKRVWNITGYVDVEKPKNNNGITVGHKELVYLGDDNYLLEMKSEVNAVVCVGNPVLRRRIVEKLQENSYVLFPNVILGNTRICEDVKLGTGCMISMGTSISTNVKIGSFVFVNMGCLVCHDGNIGDFVTLSPDVRLAGNVRINSGCEIGMGSKVIQGIEIGENTISGAGSVIVNDIAGNCTVAGVPAKNIRG